MRKRKFWRLVELGGSIAIVLFSLLSIAHAASKLKIIYSFTSRSDGSLPYSPVVLDGAGNLYGEAGGGNGGYGVAFSLTPCSGCRTEWVERTIYTFGSGSNGNEPFGGLLLNPRGFIYGVTGYAYGTGTVFQLPPVTPLASIHNFEGGGPVGGLVQDAVGNLFGTANGGTYGGGIVFELTPSGGSWNYQVIYNFGPLPPYGTDGYDPFGTLAIDRAGNLYGTTSEGGVYGVGTVFELSNLNGTWTESQLYDFTGSDNGAAPLAGVILDEEGNIYGTTPIGGQDGVGTVFKLTLSHSYWSHHVLHSFTGEDGGLPYYGSLAIDGAGNLYGTTKYGGRSQAGTLFKLTQDPNSGNWKETVLHSFSGGRDGKNPLWGVVVDSAGKIYGTVPVGGVDNCGVVFEYSQ